MSLNIKIETELNRLKGQILGLESVIVSILESNPGVKIDEKRIGKLILDAHLEGDVVYDAETRSAARATMHGISGLARR
jgi:hypothetical protein